MYIKKYNSYKLKYDKSFFINIRIEHDDYLYPISSLLHEIYPFKQASWYEYLTQQDEIFSRVGIFEDVEVSFDLENNLIYLSDAYDDDYRSRTKTLTQEMIIEFCKNRTLEYITITKDNFIHLVSSWVKILEYEPNFALLYLDDKGCYDVLPFETQEAMEQFVADHTQQETPQK